MKASRTTNDYVKYVHEYLKNYHPYVETAFSNPISLKYCLVSFPRLRQLPPS